MNGSGFTVYFTEETKAIAVLTTHEQTNEHVIRTGLRWVLSVAKSIAKDQNVGTIMLFPALKYVLRNEDNTNMTLCSKSFFFWIVMVL